MRKKLSKAIGAGCVLALAMGALPGCKFFDLNNPFLPKARVYAFPQPSTVFVKATLQQANGTINVEATNPTVVISTYPRDASPGVRIDSYSAEYFDQANNPIPTLVLTKVNFGVAAYLKPASGGESTVSMQLPIYNQQVRGYALDQVFSFVPEAILNRNLIHSINARVTLYGEDDNFNPIEIPFAVPIAFDGNITK